jgi:predicted nucleic acid-binding protein
LVPDEDEWENLESIQKFLKPFKEITTLMSSSTYPTLSITVPLYNSLLDHIEDTESAIEIEQTIREAAKKSKKKLLEYYNKTNDAYLIATILDPRLKM